MPDLLQAGAVIQVEAILPRIVPSNQCRLQIRRIDIAVGTRCQIYLAGSSRLLSASKNLRTGLSAAIFSAWLVTTSNIT
jgi:hypothetical protein